MQENKIEVLLLDDEPGSLAFSRRAIAHYVPDTCIHCASSVEEVMEILQTQPVQLAFLDVELPSSDGFSLCDYIHRQYPQIAVVILTGHVDLGAKSYDYEPFDFLTKPVDVLRLEKTFERFLRARQKTAPSSRMMIETSSGFVLTDPQDIFYIAKNGNACVMHCRMGEEYRVTYPLDRLEAMLADYEFFRTHQSYLVSVPRIVQVQATKFGNTYEARLDDGTMVPVSRNKFARLKEYMMRRSVHLL